MCSGAGTAESSRAVLQNIVQKFPLPGVEKTMDIQTVALWDSWVNIKNNNKSVGPLININRNGI